jgi:hypothetical protein
VPPAQWPQVIQLARYYSLSSMLLWATKQSHPQLVTSPLWDSVLADARKSGLNYVSLKNAQQQVNAAFARANIPAVWLKGIALVATVYPQPTLRPMSDLDVLVPYVQRQEALNVAESLGYQFENEANYLFGPRHRLTWALSHHFQLQGGVANRVMLEIHYKLLSRDRVLLPPEKMAWFWDQTQVYHAAGDPFTLFKPEAHLLYLCAHLFLQHGETQVFLRQSLDLHQMITRAALDWSLVVHQAAQLGWAYVVERGLVQAVELFDTPVPDNVLDQLRAARASQDSTSYAVDLTGRGAQWARIRASLSDLTWQDRLLWLFKIAFPSQAYLRKKYAIQSSRAVWPYYPYRWFDQVRSIGWWVWERLSRR